MRALSKREARLVALLILVGALVVAGWVVVQPLLEGFNERAAARRQLAERYAANRRLIGAVPRLEREAQRRDEALARFVTPALDAGAASDLLRQRVQAAISSVGGDFRGTEDVPAPARTVVTRASLRVNASQLGRLIAQLENGRPLLNVIALTVSADDALVTGHATYLDVQLELSLAYHPNPKS